MNKVSLSCLVALGSVLGLGFGLGACNGEEPTPTPATAGTGGSAPGTAGVSAGGSSAGAATGGTVSTGGGGAATAGAAGSGGMTAGNGGAGGSAAGAGGAAGGSAGSGGGTACDATTGKAISFKNSKIDNVTGDLGADFAGGNGPRTVELWAHFTGDASWAGEHTIIELGKKTSGANQVFGIDMAGRNGANGVFDPYTNGIGDYDPTPVALAVEGWHHLAWGYDGAGKFEFVVDGNNITLPAAKAGTLATTQGIITLGGSQGFGATGWEGIMDEVRLWSVFRAAADIKRDMKVKLKGTEAGLIAYWNLDEGTGTTADDVKKTASHKLAFCAAKGGACSDANDAMPAWVASDIPGPFTCAP
jgi:hypothetical protein